MRTFSASAALPSQHLERATTGLRAELRRQVLLAGVDAMPRWETFTVRGPREFADLRGRTWYEYRATVQIGTRFDRSTAADTPGHVAIEETG
jgi:hypothetical protein